MQADSGPPLPPPLWAQLSCSPLMCPPYPLFDSSAVRRSPRRGPELPSCRGRRSTRRHTAAPSRRPAAAPKTQRELRGRCSYDKLFIRYIILLFFYISLFYLLIIIFIPLMLTIIPSCICTIYVKYFNTKIFHLTSP